MPGLKAARSTGVGTDQLRRHNLSASLTLLHHDGSQPRSALTAQTGLNRSTVAALVAELTELGLVHETDPDPTKQVGRPSPTVNADRRNVAIAVNPEVDAVTAGVVTLGGRVAATVRHETASPPTAAEAVEIAAALTARLTAGLAADVRVIGVGVAAPGLVRADDGLVRLAPHQKWADEPVAAMLADATGYRVSVGNDARLGALVEHIYGSGRGVDDLVYLNGGPSGIGGGVITGGALLGGASGYAGEFGHTRAGGGGDVDLESLVRRSDLLAAVGRAAATPDELDELVLRSVEAAVLEVVHRRLAALARAVGDAINILNPPLIVLGGFLSTIFQRDPAYLQERVAAQTLAAPFEDVTIARAGLGSDLLMIGAAELTFSGLLADPAGYGRVGARE
jgi:predicted NBD/HSP70 family sugar kinase